MRAYLTLKRIFSAPQFSDDITNFTTPLSGLGGVAFPLHGPSYLSLFLTLFCSGLLLRWREGGWDELGFSSAVLAFLFF